ncbi:hypothetical protein HY969_02810 [Candidatus Kaiserbacteria bacterium]|nr:hypothetical protein [Candidatus Kaiserbacteria bacterium]
METRDFDNYMQRATDKEKLGVYKQARDAVSRKVVNLIEISNDPRVHGTQKVGIEGDIAEAKARLLALDEEISKLEGKPQSPEAKQV